MKPNVMNQSVILETEWLVTNPFSKPWRFKIYELFMKVSFRANQALRKLAGLWILRVLENVIRGIGCVLFTPPPQQEKIEQARMQAMQYRNIF